MLVKRMGNLGGDVLKEYKARGLYKGKDLQGVPPFLLTFKDDGHHIGMKQFCHPLWVVLDKACGLNLDEGEKMEALRSF